MKGKNMKKQSKTDWARVKAMKDKDIDTSDIPELTDDFFKKAVLWPGTKKQITLRLDPDVIEFFKLHAVLELKRVYFIQQYFRVHLWETRACDQTSSHN